MPREGVVLRDLGHRYGADWIFEEVSFEVGPGELVALLGESGAGKTTLLRAIAGFVNPAAGEIHLDSRAVSAPGIHPVATELRGVGVVFQDHALFEHMSVSDNIRFGLSERDGHDAQERVDELLREVGLSGFGGASPSTLSGGQRQRIALARALAPNPSVLLLDEPFASVDAQRQRALAQSLRHLVKRERVAALRVTHDALSAMRWADRIAVLGAERTEESARLLQIAEPKTIYRKPTSERVASMFAECIVLTAEGEGTQAQTALGPIELLEAATGPCEVMLRPENLRFEARPDGQHRVLSVEFEGSRERLRVRTQAGEFWVLGTHEESAPEQVGQLVVMKPAHVWQKAPR